MAHDGPSVKLVSEGVEDEATAAALREMGCEFAQGYLYGAAIALPSYVVDPLRAVV